MLAIGERRSREELGLSLRLEAGGPGGQDSVRKNTFASEVTSWDCSQALEAASYELSDLEQIA